MTTTTRNPIARLLTLLLPAATILFVIVIQAHHFRDRPYRQDEAWIVQYALENIDRVGFLNHVLQIFYRFSPEYVLQDIWVHLFGHVEIIVRYFSSLITVIALACYYRLAADLFDRRSAWVALLVLGTYSVFTYYSHEARPYAALALGTVGFQWALLRFIRRPDRRIAVLALLLGVVPFYVHPFVIYVFAAQVLCILVFVRWNRDLYRRGAVLFVLLALLIAVRAWINFYGRSGVIEYNITTSWEGLLEWIDHFRFNPEALGYFLLAVGVFGILNKLARPRPVANDSRMRFAWAWREGWLLLSLATMLVLTFFVNNYVPSLTPRNLLITAPYLALIVTVGLRRLPLQAQLIALIFFCAPFVTQFRSHNGNAGYWELAEYIDQHYDRGADRLLIITEQAWEWIAIDYFLKQRTGIEFADDDIFYVSWERADKDDFGPGAIDEQVFVTGLAKGDWRRLQPWLGDAEKLWIIRTRDFIGGRNMIDAIEGEYTLYGIIDFPGQTYYTAIEVLEYRRHPADTRTRWRYGADFNLLDWRLNDDHHVGACQTITVDSWWSLNNEIEQLYSSTLVIVDQHGQGAANSDSVPGGVYLTSIWRPGRPYFDERQLMIPCDLPAGEYPLLLGMYELPPDENTALQNLEIYTADGEPTGRYLEFLTTITVSR
ncbi:MAG: glycosyltransferase family 39 protein [Chloroflexi bacterium]|nr:glycosyltransferase family 39 protein [Chloroflexota bacterium]